MKNLMQKFAAILCITVAAVQLCACGSSSPDEAALTAPATSSAAETESETAEPADKAETETDVESIEDTKTPAQSSTEALPNPMVEITDAAAFAEKLGITIDPTYIAGETTMYIIGEKMAEIDFPVTNIDGDEVLCTLRAVKQGEDISNISGIYEEMDEVKESYSCNETTIDVTHKTSKSSSVQIYEFNYNNISYCFSYDGELSTMLFGEVFDGVLCAVGAEKTEY